VLHEPQWLACLRAEGVISLPLAQLPAPEH